MDTHSTPWVEGETFASVLAQTIANNGERDAVVFPQLGFRQSYREFGAEVERLARGLLALGIKPGENIGIWSTNWPQWVQLQFAAASVGAVLVNVNPAYRAHELDYVIDQADLTTLVLTDRFKTSDFEAILAEALEQPNADKLGLPASRFPKLRHAVSIKDTSRPGILTWKALRQRAEEVPVSEFERRRGAVRPEDVVSIQYTSGTTGFPKGAMLTHRNLLLNAYYVGVRLKYGPGDRLCIPVPFYHCFGCVLGTLMCVVHGATMVVPAESFDPEATLAAIHSERCTGLYGVPTMFIAELNHPKRQQYDLASLRTGMMAGSPCPIEVMRAVVGDLGAKEITIGYGLTEASPIITQTEASDSLEHRVGTVGRALPGLEVGIVMPGSLNPVAEGETGELIVRGHAVMRGYYNKPLETSQSIVGDGWLRSGDLAAKTADGYYRITGRIKDMIIRGGENVYPREIEEFLYSHPAIADVQVVGLPDDHFGEEVSAWIRLKEGASLTEDELRSFCKGKIAHFKVPRYIVFVTEYPTTVTGKIQKFKLREMGVERFGLHKAAAVETA